MKKTMAVVCSAVLSLNFVNGAPLRESDKPGLEKMYGFFNGLKAVPNDGVYVRTSAELPEIVWLDPASVAENAGETSFTGTVFFDKDAVIVDSFKESGLYLAKVEARSAKFGLIQTLVPFFYRKDDAMPSSTELDAWQKRRLPGRSWGAWGADIKEDSPQYVFLTEKDPAKWLSLIEKTPDGAAIMASITAAGSEPDKDSFEASPYVKLYRQAIKVRFAAGKVPERSAPAAQTLTQPAKVLSRGSEKEAGFKEGTAAKLRAAAQRWFHETGDEPFSIIVARDGVIFFSESFGFTPEGRKVDEHTNMLSASISKFMNGMTFATFMDEGLISPEDTVSKVFPAFEKRPDGNPSKITFHDCFVHSAGMLDRHGSFGGLSNPYLDSVFWNISPAFESGAPALYEGDGMNLAARAMEILSGKPMMDIVTERIMGPLGLKLSCYAMDMGWSFCFSAMDLATLAQTALNEGSYGNKALISKKTWRKLFPSDGRFFGIGMTPMVIRVVKEDGSDAEETIFPPDYFYGHGAATGATFYFSPSDKLLVVASRSGQGKIAQFKIERAAFMKIIADNIIRDGKQ